MKEQKNKSLIEVHIAVLFFGLAGLFGKLILLPSLVIVFGRVVFASLFLGSILLLKKQSIRLEKGKDYCYFIILGFILALHWVTFFLAIQMSTVAIGLLMFSTFPVFVTFIEPVFFKYKICMKDIVIAVITFFGVSFVMPEFKFESSITQGALWGILSGFTFAILSILNKKYVGKYNSIVISFYQDLVATLLLLPLILVLKPIFQTKDVIFIAVLGIVFTGIAHTLFINGLKNVKAQTASIIASLEPVYGILATAIIIGEIPSLREIVGGIIILATTSYATFKTK
ncbi:DMT family transporter [Crassaminicella profunda]|nr:DMT family transporter [Crassaminicella profunda]